MESSITTVDSVPTESPRLVRLLSLVVEPAFWLSTTIAATMFSGNWGLLGIPIPLDRVCFVLTLVTLGLRVPIGASGRLRLRGVHWAMLIAVAYTTGSAVISGSLLTHNGSFALLDRLGLVPFLSFMVAPIAFASSRQRTILLATLTITGAYLGLTALFEALHVNALVFPKYILDPNVGIHEGRARGPFVEAGANGMALWVCIVAATVLAQQLRRNLTRYACVAVALVGVSGILFTLTRGTWLGAAVGGLVTLAFYRPLRKYLFPATLASAAMIAIALATIPSLASSVQSRSSNSLTVWDRYNLNNAAINMAEAHPLFGVGWQQFPANAEHYYQLGKTYPLVTAKDVHNLLLSNLAELGLIGVTFWLAALVLGLGGALTTRVPRNLRPWQYGLMAILVEWVVAGMFSPLALAFANTSLWVWAGIVYGPAASPLMLVDRHRVSPPLASDDQVRFS